MIKHTSNSAGVVCFRTNTKYLLWAAVETAYIFRFCEKKKFIKKFRICLHFLFTNNTDTQITLYYNTVNRSSVLTLDIYRPSTAVLEVSNAGPVAILKETMKTEVYLRFRVWFGMKIYSKILAKLSLLGWKPQIDLRWTASPVNRASFIK